MLQLLWLRCYINDGNVLKPLILLLSLESTLTTREVSSQMTVVCVVAASIVVKLRIHILFERLSYRDRLELERYKYINN